MVGETDAERMSDTSFRLTPRGLFDSIVEASSLGKPMYITETGLADKQDMHRAWFIKSHYQQVRGG